MKPNYRFQWILKYLQTEESRVDILNSEFVNAYLCATQSSFYAMPYGANKCPQLGRDLSALFKAKKLIRSRVGIDLNMGFPKWVYVYRLPDQSSKL